MPVNGHSTTKSGPLIYTDSFVYNVADVLGKGATASVYLARSRENGNQVAVKVFAERESRHITTARIRETELLRSTNHKNIMKLIACERERDTNVEVIVLEYCQGGSVYTLLEQPANGYGFPEKECLIFLRDITEGLKYLKTCGIIHRDIKPGNIMKKIEEDGSSVYVLTDFGAARELGDEETFCSIYGTEEYIHPDMFQCGVLRLPGDSNFTASVDLWSLGVTVFQVFTGRLPFQAFAGRSDSHTMFKIISDRTSGDVSGIQRSQAGPIERSKELPETTTISRCLRSLMKPIIAGLFEADRKKALTFDQYFEMVHEILEMMTINVFFSNTSTNIKIYLRKSDRFVHIQEQVASMSDIPADRQLLIMDCKELSTVVPIDEQIVSYPKSVQKSQFYLFERDNYDVRKPEIPTLPPFPSLIVNTSLSNDATVAKQSAAVAYFIEAKTKEILQNQFLSLEALFNIRHFVQGELKEADILVPQLETQLSLTDKRLQCLHRSQQNLGNFGKLLELHHDDRVLKTALGKFCSPDKNLSDVLQKTVNRCNEIQVYLDVLKQKLKEHSAPGPTDHMGCSEQDECLVKVGHLRQGIQSIASTFSKHKKYGELHPHEQFIHGVEREKFENLCVKIVSLYQSHCVPNLKQLHHSVQKHIGLLMKHLTREGKVEVNINCVIDCQRQIVEKIDKMDESYNRVTELITPKVAQILSNPSSMLKVARREVRAEISSEGASVKTSQKASLLQQLMSEVTSLQSESSEIDSIMNSNMNSLLELKRMLEDTSRLDPTSFQHDKRCTDSLGKRLARVPEHTEITTQAAVLPETHISQPPFMTWERFSNTPQSNVTDRYPQLEQSLTAKQQVVTMASATVPETIAYNNSQSNGVMNTESFTIYDRCMNTISPDEATSKQLTSKTNGVSNTFTQLRVSDTTKTVPNIVNPIAQQRETNYGCQQKDRSPTEHVENQCDNDGKS